MFSLPDNFEGTATTGNTGCDHITAVVSPEFIRHKQSTEIAKDPDFSTMAWRKNHRQLVLLLNQTVPAEYSKGVFLCSFEQPLLKKFLLHTLVNKCLHEPLMSDQDS